MIMGLRRVRQQARYSLTHRRVHGRTRRQPLQLHSRMAGERDTWELNVDSQRGTRDGDERLCLLNFDFWTDGDS